MKHFPFGVVQKDGDRPAIKVEYKGEDKEFFPEEISAMVHASRIAAPPPSSCGQFRPLLPC